MYYYLTLALNNYFTVLLSLCITLSLYHYTTISLYHSLTTSLYNVIPISLFNLSLNHYVTVAPSISHFFPGCISSLFTSVLNITPCLLGYCDDETSLYIPSGIYAFLHPVQYILNEVDDSLYLYRTQVKDSCARKRRRRRKRKRCVLVVVGGLL